MASYNAARAYGLRNIGAIAPGYKGDMVLFEDLKDFKALQVFTRFGKPYDPGFTMNRAHPAPAGLHSVRAGPGLYAADLALKAKEVMPVIGLTEGQLVTPAAGPEGPAGCPGLLPAGWEAEQAGGDRTASPHRQHWPGDRGGAQHPQRRHRLYGGP